MKFDFIYINFLSNDRNRLRDLLLGRGVLQGELEAQVEERTSGHAGIGVGVGVGV